MSSRESAPVTVLGAGIVGLCTALFLEKAGVHVRLIDPSEPGQGASFGNAGVISPWSIVPQSVPGLWKHLPAWLLRSDGPISVRPAYAPYLLPWVMRFLSAGKQHEVLKTADAMLDMNRDNVDLYRDILSACGKPHLIQDSFYVHAYRNPKLANTSALEYAIRKDRGAELEKIGEAELKSLEPAISLDFKAAILIKNQGRAISPGKISEAIAAELVRSGSEFIRGQVTGLGALPDRCWTIKTDQGKLSAATVIVAMGAWSAQILKTIGVHLPMETERGYHAEFRSPATVINHSVMDMDFKMVASSMGEQVRVAGMAEFAGLDYPTNAQRTSNLINLAKKMIPGLAEDTQPSVWMGSRPSMPDSLPCIGPIEGFDNLFAAFGHSHYGLMMAPRTGQVIADLVTGNSPDIDLTPFCPERFSKTVS